MNHFVKNRIFKFHFLLKSKGLYYEGPTVNAFAGFSKCSRVEVSLDRTFFSLSASCGLLFFNHVLLFYMHDHFFDSFLFCF